MEKEATRIHLVKKFVGSPGCDFWEITKDALSYALDCFEIDQLECFDELCASYLEIPCYSEVPRFLKNLKNQGQKIVILSNGSPFMINSAVNANNLQYLFDEIISVEDVGIYKPDRKVYNLVEEKLGVIPEKLTFSHQTLGTLQRRVFLDFL